MDAHDRSIRPDELLAQLGWVRALARSLVFDADMADDVLQQVCLLALERAPREAREGPRLRAWLAAVTHSLVGRSRRSDGRRVRRERVVAQAAAQHDALPSALEIAQHREALRALVDAVTSLEEPYFSTVVERYFEGRSVADIAARHGLSAVGVRQRLSRARQQLRERLVKLIDDEPGGWLRSVLPLSAARASLESAGTHSTLGHLGGVVVAKQVGLGGAVKAVMALVVAVGLLFVTAHWLQSGDGEEGTPSSAVPPLPASAVTRAPELPATVSAEHPIEPIAAPPAESALAPLEPGDVLARRDGLAVTIVGRIVDEAGRPLPDAQVELRGPDFGDASFQEVLLASALSGSDGRFAIPVTLPPELHLPQHQLFLQPMAEGPDLWVTRPEQQAVIQAVPVTQAGETQVGDVVLPTGAAIALTALAASGSAVRGARVELAYASKLDRSGRLALERLQLRDAGADRFIAEGLPAGTTAVTLFAEGLVSSTLEGLELRVGETTELGALALEPAQTLSGSVTDPQKQPIAGAWVVVSPAKRFAKLADAPQDLRQAAENVRREARPEDVLTTDADGRFRSGPLAPGRYGLAAGAPGYTSRLRKLIELPSPPLTLALQPEGRLMVTIVDGETRRPLKPELVQLRDDAGTLRVLEPTPGDDGSQTYVSPSAREASLLVRCAGYAPQACKLGGIGPDETRADTVPLVRGCSVRGRITDATGAPLAQRGVFVDPTYSELGRFGVEWQARSDAEGRFDLGLLPPGRWTLAAGGGSYAELATAVKIEPEQHELEVPLVLLAAARVSGRILDGNGAPVGRHAISLLPRTQARMGVMTRADADGRYEFEGVAPGAYKLNMIAPQAERDFDLASGQQATLDLIVPAPARIFGVVSSAGGPLAGATVELHHEVFGGLMPFRKVVTDERGAYAFEELELDGYGVSATPVAGSRSPVLEVAVTPGAQVVADLLLSGGAIAGLAVLEEGGAPLAGVVVTLRQPEGDVSAPPSGGDGSFSFALVAPGSVVLEAAAQGFATILRRIEVGVDPGRPASARLQFAPQSTVEGEVHSADGTALPGALTLRLTRDDEPDFERRQPIELGRYRIEGLPAGSYRAAVLRQATPHPFSKQGKLLVETSFTLGRGQALRHDVALPGT